MPVTPADAGFAMPAEWARHDGCWMLWPTRLDTWRNGGRPAQEQWLAVIEAIAAAEPVSVGVREDLVDQVAAQLPTNATAVPLDSDDAWMRDVGPTVLAHPDGRRLGVDWGFNAWGGIYEPFDRDQAVAAAVLERERIDRVVAPLVLEGGSIHVDGEGTLLATEECLLHPNRNSQLGQDQIEGLLADHLGIRSVIWLGRGVHLDETDGHIDNLACFVGSGAVVVTVSTDPDDPQTAISSDAVDRLRRAVDATGEPLQVHSLPSPGPLYLTDDEAAGLSDGTSIERVGGRRLAGSYVNFYLANGRVVAPLLDERTDDEALATLESLFPDRTVIGVPTREILLGGGNIHCITQQIPTALSG